MAIRLEPREALFFALSGDIDTIGNNFPRAERAYNNAPQRDDGFFYHYLRRGQIRNALDRFALARVDLECSLELLPTSEANLLLGNLERRSGDPDAAIQYYQAASVSNSATGKEALKELVRLELPTNPGKFIQTETLLGRDGSLNIVLLNNAPLSVNRIILKIEYIDNDDQLQQFSRHLSNLLKAGSQTTIYTPVRDITDADELSGRVRITVLRAQVASE